MSAGGAVGALVEVAMSEWEEERRGEERRAEEQIASASASAIVADGAKLSALEHSYCLLALRQRASLSLSVC